MRIALARPAAAVMLGITSMIGASSPAAAQTASISVTTSALAGHTGNASCPGKANLEVASGAPITWCYAVTNTGSVPVEQLATTDSVVDITFFEFEPLAPGATAVYSIHDSAADTVSNSVRASGDADGTAVGASASARVTVTAAPATTTTTAPATTTTIAPTTTAPPTTPPTTSAPAPTTPPASSSTTTAPSITSTTTQSTGGVTSTNTTIQSTSPTSTIPGTSEDPAPSTTTASSTSASSTEGTTESTTAPGVAREVGDDPSSSMVTSGPFPDRIALADESDEGRSWGPLPAMAALLLIGGGAIALGIGTRRP